MILAFDALRQVGIGRQTSALLSHPLCPLWLKPSSRSSRNSSRRLRLSFPLCPPVFPVVSFPSCAFVALVVKVSSVILCALSV
jgi:hypothetical protein